MPEFTCYAWKRVHAKMFNVATSIISVFTFMTLALSLGFGADSESKMLAVYCFIAAVLFGVPTVFFYFYLRFKIEIYEEGNRWKVKVSHLSLSQPVMLESPFELIRHWNKEVQGKSLGKRIYLTISTGGLPQLTFSAWKNNSFKLLHTFVHMEAKKRQQRKALPLAPLVLYTKKADRIAQMLGKYVSH